MNVQWEFRRDRSKADKKILHSSSIGERIVVGPGIKLGKAFYLTSHSVWFCNLTVCVKGMSLTLNPLTSGI